MVNLNGLWKSENGLLVQLIGDVRLPIRWFEGPMSSLDSMATLKGTIRIIEGDDKVDGMLDDDLISVLPKHDMILNVIETEMVLGKGKGSYGFSIWKVTAVVFPERLRKMKKEADAFRSILDGR